MPIPWVAWLMWLWVNAAIAYLLLVVSFVIIAQPIKWIVKVLSYILDKLANSWVACMILWVSFTVVVTARVVSLV